MKGHIFHLFASMQKCVGNKDIFRNFHWLNLFSPQQDTYCSVFCWFPLFTATLPSIETLPWTIATTVYHVQYFKSSANGNLLQQKLHVCTIRAIIDIGVISHIWWLIILSLANMTCSAESICIIICKIISLKIISY